MMGPVDYHRDGPVAVITLDDGKVNALGPGMQQAINAALDRADADGAGALVIAGNHRVFSGGFDLKVMNAGQVQPVLDMLRGGFELAYRLLSHPNPVVLACTGHAIAMGSFLLCSGDHRVAAPGYNIQANETAIGMVLPYAALTLMELRLTSSAYQQAVGLSNTFVGETAVAAGWIDELVLPEAVLPRAVEAAREFTDLSQTAHAANKLRARRTGLAALRAAIDDLPAEFGL